MYQSIAVENMIKRNEESGRFSEYQTLISEVNLPFLSHNVGERQSTFVGSVSIYIYIYTYIHSNVLEAIFRLARTSLPLTDMGHSSLLVVQIRMKNEKNE